MTEVPPQPAENACRSTASARLGGGSPPRPKRGRRGSSHQVSLKSCASSSSPHLSRTASIASTVSLSLSPPSAAATDLAFVKGSSTPSRWRTTPASGGSTTSPDDSDHQHASSRSPPLVLGGAGSSGEAFAGSGSCQGLGDAADDVLSSSPPSPPPLPMHRPGPPRLRSTEIPLGLASRTGAPSAWPGLEDLYERAGALSTAEDAVQDLDFGMQRLALRGRTEVEPSGDDLSDAFEVVDGLGHGGFSIVLLVRHIPSGRLHAMKVVHKAICGRNADARHRQLNEIAITTQLPPSPFVQRFCYAFETSTAVMMVGDLYTSGDLFDHLAVRCEQGRGFSERRTKAIVAEIVLALRHIHLHGYIHRDLKIENIMVDSTGHIKLIDFGLGHRLIDGSELNSSGSAHYLAPETITHHRVGTFTDWWALGVLTHELASSCAPWTVMQHSEELTRQIVSAPLMLSPHITPRTGNFVARLLTRDYRARLGTFGAREVMRHPFFRSVNWSAVENLSAPPPLTLRDRLADLATHRKPSLVEKYRRLVTP